MPDLYDPLHALGYTDPEERLLAEGRAEYVVWKERRQQEMARERGELFLCPSCEGALKNDQGDECQVCEVGEVTREEWERWRAFNAPPDSTPLPPWLALQVCLIALMLGVVVLVALGLEGRGR
jgi:hypothetical protein